MFLKEFGKFWLTSQKPSYGLTSIDNCLLCHTTILVYFWNITDNSFHMMIVQNIMPNLLCFFLYYCFGQLVVDFPKGSKGTRSWRCKICRQRIICDFCLQEKDARDAGGRGKGKTKGSHGWYCKILLFLGVTDSTVFLIWATEVD